MQVRCEHSVGVHDIDMRDLLLSSAMHDSSVMNAKAGAEWVVSSTAAGRLLLKALPTKGLMPDRGMAGRLLSPLPGEERLFHADAPSPRRAAFYASPKNLPC